LSQRAVIEREIYAAQVESFGFLAAGAGFLYVRPLPDGRVIYLAPLLTGTVLGISANGTDRFYTDRWDYPRDPDLCEPDSDWRAVLGWDGNGEPEGWYRHVPSGRRRPGGDPAKEHVPR
jgi:hypothetical protein